MPHDPRFGPNAQTPQQRANVLRQLQNTHPRLLTHATPLARQLYDRYVAGELSWSDVRRALDDARD